MGDSGADGRPKRPSDDSWVVSVHATTERATPVGTGVVIDDTRILTCRHVARLAASSTGLGRVRFVKRRSESADYPSVPVARWGPALNQDCEDHCDIVVGHLAGPIPDGVTPARLRNPGHGELHAKSWWSFGFGRGDHYGDEASGAVGSEAGMGWLRLSTTSEYVVERGFSGAAIWSADYDAVVGFVTQAAQGQNNGDGRAITVRGAIACLPDEKLELLMEWTLTDAPAQDQAEWGIAGSAPAAADAGSGWSLTDDPATTEHWEPRARGVTLAGEQGWRFRGRRAALEVVRSFLDQLIPPRGPLVVTGSPGVGKSAVVARMVTTADRGIAEQLPTDDTAVRATVGSVSCAVHAKGKTALEVARAIARAASVRLPEGPEEIEHFANWLVAGRGEGSGRFNLVVDALDEAATPADARLIARHLVRALAETGASRGIGVVVATRRDDAKGSLLDCLQPASTVVDLDAAEFFDLGDLEDYAQATVRLVGDERPESPYADPAVAAPVAQAIARIAKGNFLVAGLTAREHGLFDHKPVPVGQLGPARSVNDALLRYVARIGTVDVLGSERCAEDVLTVLAFAEAPGFTLELWVAGIDAIYGTRLGSAALRRFAGSAAASFLVQSVEGSAAPTFRLFHQALNDSLLAARATMATRVADEAALTQAFLGLARLDWDRAPAYIARSLVSHARRGHLVDTLLLDDNYLLRADLYRLRSAGLGTTTDRGRRRQRLIALTSLAAAADPPTRAALFSVTNAMERLDVGLELTVVGQPYRARWAQAAANGELARLEGHTGSVQALAALPVGDQTLLVSGGLDGTVRLWDPATGEERGRLEGHTGSVRALAAVPVGDRVLLASAGRDGTVRLSDPATGEERGRLKGCAALALAAVPVDARVLLASAGRDGTVRLWDPATGEERARLAGHTEAVQTLAAVPIGDRVLLASGGRDGTVRLWDPATGEERARLAGYADWVRALAAVPVGDRTLLVSGDREGTVRLWDPATGEERARVEGYADWVQALVAVPVGDQVLLASGGRDGTVRLWDPATGEERAQAEGYTDWGQALAAVPVGDRVLLASGGSDRTVRLWDPATGEERARLAGHTGSVLALATMPVGDRTLLASGGSDRTVRLWDPATGEERARLAGHTGSVLALATMPVGDRTLLASGGSDRTVRLWDPATGEERARLAGHTGSVLALATMPVGDRTLLASGDDHGTLWLWDPAGDGRGMRVEGHTGSVQALAVVPVGDRVLLAVGGSDRTVWLWDPVDGEKARLEGHTGWVRALAAVPIGDRVLLASGGGLDRTVWLWDPATGRARATAYVHSAVNALVAIGSGVAFGLQAGVGILDFLAVT